MRAKSAGELTATRRDGTCLPLPSCPALRCSSMWAGLRPLKAAQEFDMPQKKLQHRSFGSRCETEGKRFRAGWITTVMLLPVEPILVR